MDQVFIIVISGVLIFAAQRIISDMWIATNIDFQKCLSKAEVLVIKANGMYPWAFKKNNLESSRGMPMDEEIKEIKREINLITWDLLKSYNSLFFLEKFWLKIRGVDINMAKQALLSLSVLICSDKDFDGGKSKSKEKINEICGYLKFNKEFLV